MRKAELRTSPTVVLLGVVLALVGCSATAPSPPVHKPHVEVLVTREGASLPDGCGPRQVAGLVTSFFDDFIKGEQSKLSRFFVSEGPTGPGLFGSGGNYVPFGPCLSSMVKGGLELRPQYITGLIIRLQKEATN
jgi:hypothetical protein